MTSTKKAGKKEETQIKKPVDWELVRSLFRGRWLLLLAPFVATAGAYVAAYISPQIIRISVDSVIGNLPIQAPDWVLNMIESFGGRSVLARNIWICSLAVIAAAIANSIFVYIRGRASAILCEDIAKDLSERMYDHLQHLSYQYHVDAETGDLLQRSSSDVETIRRFIGMQFVELARIISAVTLGVIIMLSMDVSMTLVTLSIAPAIVIFSVIFFKKVQVVFKEMDESEGRLSNVIQESLSGVRVVRAFGQQKQEMNKFDAGNGEFRKNIIKINDLMGFFWGFTDMLTFAQTALVITLSVWHVSRGDFSVGTMIAFSSYVGMMLWPLRQLGRILVDMSKASVALARVSEVLAAPREPDDGRESDKPLSGDIVFDHVSFAYPNGRQVLSDISFTAKQGQTIAVLGSTGSGKS
ncbi:MAG: ABC transporter ATP-binding protein, partial [Oscillospiraceae bacterium]|nr:ABC transporter ATP-binding protein [Oscillospiraceae bacterium]